MPTIGLASSGGLDGALALVLRAEGPAEAGVQGGRVTRVLPSHES
jgi:hypothetical protein